MTMNSEVTTVTPKGYDPERYVEWCQWMFIQHGIKVSSRARAPRGSMDGMNGRSAPKHPART